MIETGKIINEDCVEVMKMLKTKTNRNKISKR